MLDFVRTRYSSVLNSVEIAFAETFYELPQNAQMLLTRCYMRKGSWFRIDKMKYDEIADIELAAQRLIDASLMQQPQLQESFDWLKLFTKSEIIQYFKQPGWKSLKRTALDQAVTEWCQTNVVPEQLHNHFLVQVPQDIFDTYRLLFFGNLRRDLTEFVLQDLGMIAYELYTISQSNLPVQTRAEMDALKRLHQLSEILHESRDVDVALLMQLEQQLPRIDSTAPLYRRRLYRVINRLAREYERLAEWQSAIRLYLQSQQLPANERRIRCYEKLGMYPIAWQELQQLKTHSSSQEEQQFVSVFEKKLAKRLDKTPVESPVYLPVEDTLTLLPSGHSVEQDVVEHLNKGSGEAFWVENAVFNTLFGIIYWPMLFDDIEGAFYNPFQTLPADIYDPQFIQRRSKTYQSLKKTISNDELLLRHIWEVYQQKKGIACQFTVWPALDSELLEKVLHCLPLEHIRKITHRILSDPKENRSGQPDLLYFSASGSYRLIEVKGPGDRLQNNQKRWMAFYQQHDIPHQVIRVDYVTRE